MKKTPEILHHEKLLTNHPNDADLLHTLGILYAKAHYYNEAINKIQQAIQIKSNDASYYNSLGNIYRKLNQSSNAKKAFQKAIKINPNYAIVHNNIGNVFFDAQEYIAAKKSYEKAIELNENYADAYANLGILLTQTEHEKAAIAALLKAVSLNSEHTTALNQLGDCYLRAQDYQKAGDIFLRVVSINPNNSESQHRLGIAYFYLKEFKKAQEQFEQTLLLNYNHPEANQYLANTYLQLRDHEKALHYYFRQLDKQPLFETYYNLGVLLMMQDHFKDALLYFDQALTMNPDDIATYLNCGSIYLKSNQLEEAIKSYEAALKYNPQDEEIRHILSAIKQQSISAKAPAAYITHLFDQYAPYYEHHLTARLDYQVPQKIEQVLALDFPNTQFHTILDLGCGTGVCGAYLKPLCQKLIGVDLSEAMLTLAREKNCYDELICADIMDALNRFNHVDLMIAADVLPYFGDLNPLFSSMKKALAKNGIFIFNVEKTTQKDFILQTSIRYAHRKNYIESLSHQYQFNIIRFDNLVLRKQKNEPVEGYVVVLIT